MRGSNKAASRTASGCVAALALAAGLAVTGPVHGTPPPVTWQQSTSSPRAFTPDARSAALMAACGAPDSALVEAAGRMARHQADSGATLRADELAFNLRAAGDPHIWPRVWTIAGQGLDDGDLGRRLKAWIAPWHTLGTRRCGLARVSAANGNEVVAAVAVDALADISPLPTTARVSQWLALDGVMLVPASSVQVILLGPRGAPKTVPSSLTGSRIQSRFSVDQPGGWLVQVLATVSTGPRPVLEAMVYAGTPPPTQFVPASAPGEAAGAGARDDDDAILRMLNGARASEGLAVLTRDAMLDKLARRHSEEMMKAGYIGHDVGSGDPATRLRAAGVTARVVGENVAASSTTLENAHRALWASPSHRGNMLANEFVKTGVAVVRGPDGTVWVTELFSS
jgi:uncharacterized protein YkwD